jgi:hypothetical protein
MCFWFECLLNKSIKYYIKKFLIKYINGKPAKRRDAKLKDLRANAYGSQLSRLPKLWEYVGEYLLAFFLAVFLKLILRIKFLKKVQTLLPRA